jgi:hypothetical protein
MVHAMTRPRAVAKVVGIPKRRNSIDLVVQFVGTTVPRVFDGWA